MRVVSVYATLGPRVVRMEACLSIRCKGAVPSLTGSGIDKGWARRTKKKGYSVPEDVSVSACLVCLCLRVENGAKPKAANFYFKSSKRAGNRVSLFSKPAGREKLCDAACRLRLFTEGARDACELSVSAWSCLSPESEPVRVGCV